MKYPPLVGLMLCASLHLANAQTTTPDWQGALNALSAAINAQQQQITTLQQQMAACQSQSPPTPAPPTPVVTESPSGTTITPGGGTITDQQGNVWSINSSELILKNGVGAYNGWQSTELAYHNHTVFQFGLDKQWWQWNGSAFTGPVTSPL